MSDEARTVLAIAAPLTAAAVVAWFIVRPGWHDAFVWTFRCNLVRLLTALLADLEDDKAAREALRASVQLVFPERLAMVDGLRDQVEANADAIRMLEESTMRQGAALTQELASAVRSMADSNNKQTQVLEQIREELKEHGVQLGRMDERIKAWDGADRRHMTRRHGVDE